MVAYCQTPTAAYAINTAAFNTETCRKDIAFQVSQFLASGCETDVRGRLADTLVPVSPTILYLYVFV